MMAFLVLFLFQTVWSAPSYFQESYEHSRSKFRQYETEWTSKIPGTTATRTSYQVPSLMDNDLIIDTLLIGNPSNKKLLVLIGGVHGPEAFTGSALQHFFLNERAEQFAAQNISLFIIHSPNPYGFKSGRRVTEANVDLNRNFLNFTEAAATLSDRNQDYPKLRPLLAPKGPATNILFSFFNVAQGMISELLFGTLSRKEINNAVAGGQFAYPKDLFYGGQKLEPQSAWMIEQFKEQFQGKEKIVLLDLHTGLGDRAVLHLITDRSDEQVFQFLQGTFPEFIKRHPGIRLTTASTPGFYQTQGDLLGFAEQLAAKEQNVLGVTMEFGTQGSGMLSQLRSLNRMVLENQGFHYGFETPRVQKQVGLDFQELFFPSQEDWRTQVIERADQFFGQLLISFK